MKRAFGWATVAFLTFGASAKQPEVRLHLRYGVFDPVYEAASLEKKSDPTWRARPQQQLSIVQFSRPIEPEFLSRLKELGGSVYGFVPVQSVVARVSDSAAASVAQLPFVRWVGPYHPAYKIEQTLSATLADAAIYQLMAVSREEREILTKEVASVGGRVLALGHGSSFLTAELTGDQVRQICHSDALLWMNEAGPIELDMDNARIQGGANELERIAGYSGQGVRGHVMEGVYGAHPDFAAKGTRGAPIAVGDSRPDDHGSQTFGIVFGDGRNRASARGMLPDAQGYYTNTDYLDAQHSRIDLVRQLMTDHRILFQTASWGFPTTTQYTAASAEMDELIFELDLPITQSQSNTGSPSSRPQAWAKNIISVGALRHQDNADPSDERWNGGSIGPAEDGRIKPDVSAYYDKTQTTRGLSGYTLDFGGTSGATPIVAGHLGLLLQLWTDGVFGNPLRNPGGDRFSNRPHASMAKALVIHSARQYPFTGAGHNLARVHQGWGFPNVKDLHGIGTNLLAVDETEALSTGGSRTYYVPVADGQREFRATLVYSEPPALPASALQLVNDLNLRVTAPSGAVYWGNHGLLQGNFSIAGGAPNTVDPVENVIISVPEQGTWSVEVIASQVNVDAHVETPELDADFSLLASAH